MVLAREALSSGDKIMSENYLQHADHFSRLLNSQEIPKISENSNNVIEQNFKKEIDNSKKNSEEVSTNLEDNKSN